MTVHWDWGAEHDLTVHDVAALFVPNDVAAPILSEGSLIDLIVLEYI